MEEHRWCAPRSSRVVPPNNICDPVTGSDGLLVRLDAVATLLHVRASRLHTFVALQTVSHGSHAPPPCRPRALADLRAQVVGLVVYVAAFFLWVALFQTRWQQWGSFGTDLLIWVPDERWWV